MPSITVDLPDSLDDWMLSRVASGGYRDAADYVLDLVGRDRLSIEENEAIAAALVEGERSGPGRRLVPDILSRLREERTGDAA